MDRAVHFRLFVSLQMVQQVVEQGQWNRVNTSTHKAVTQVQPFYSSRPCRAESSHTSTKAPWDR